MVYKKWYTCDLRLQLKKLIDSKLKKHGRDVIKQSVIFAPENNPYETCSAVQRHKIAAK